MKGPINGTQKDFRHWDNVKFGLVRDMGNVAFGDEKGIVKDVTETGVLEPIGSDILGKEVD